MRAPLYSSDPGEIFEPHVIADPQSLYARLRAESPIARVADTGVHLLATWGPIEEALSREADFSANLTGVLMRTPSGEPGIFALPASMSEDAGNVIATADEPTHSVHRAILQPRFSGASVARLEERVRGWAREAVGEWLEAGAGDFVPVAELVPARVVGDLLGLPEGDVSRFRTWAMIGGDILAGNLDASRLGLLAAEAAKMGEYLGEHLDRAGEENRREPGETLMHVLAAAVAEGRIGRSAAIGIATVMFSAGGESTAALIGSMARRLAEDHETTEALRADRSLVPKFLEEVARLESPFNFHYRLVRRDCALGGFALHAGDRLMLVWASANRDPSRVEDPDALRLDRKHAKDHLTFGRGSHFCIGAPIARMEARLVCEALLDATRSTGLRAGHPPVYANSIMSRRLETLCLDAEPARASRPR